MLGIKSIGIYLPENRIDNVARAKEFDRSEDFIREKVGFVSLPRIDNLETTSDMCVKAWEDLQKRVCVDLADIECLVLCTQNPDNYGLPHTSAIIHEKIAAHTNMAVFDISLGCSGYVYSLNVVTSFMAANGMHKGLLFTADPYSKVIDPKDYVTDLIFGDGATCTYISDDPVYKAGKTLFATDGTKHRAIAVDGETGQLGMSGQDVFKFTMKVVPKQIAACLEANGLSKEDIDLVLLHQASRYIVDNMTKKLKFPADKVPFISQKTGNTVSSTIPMMLADQILDQHKHILLSGFGVGLSWATSILIKNMSEG